MIAANVAEELVKKGLFEDAINMYELAGVIGFLFICYICYAFELNTFLTLQNIERVFEICCTLLSQVVSETKRPGSLRERLTSTCNNLKERYINMPIPLQIQQTFTILNQLVVFFDQYHSNNYLGALEVSYNSFNTLFYQKTIYKVYI